MVSSKADSPPSNGKVNILIVDDRKENLMVLEAIVADLQGNVIKAHSGREALKYLLNNDVAVVLLDVNMPDMDGFETASLIRQRKTSEHTPIIFVTAFDAETHMAKSYSLGAVDYICTPVVPEVLKAKVAVFVELYRMTEEVRQQAEALRQRAALLHKLTGASLAINAELAMDRMLQVIAEKCREVIGVHQAQVKTVLEQAGETVRHFISLSDKFKAWRGKKPAASAFDSFASALDRPLRLSQAELEAHPTLGAAPDVLAPGGGLAPGDGAPGGAARVSNGGVPLRGWLSAPLVGREGRKMGLISVSDKENGEFTEEDEAIIAQLAQSASIAIENLLFRDAREANRLKDEFLATLSHELRTPLNAILGWTQMLRMGKLDEPSVSRGLEVIERNVRAQTQLIDDLLDISRIIAGKLRLTIREVEVVPVIQEAIDSLLPAAESKEIRIVPSLDPAASRVTADPDRLQQVVWNLLSNAIKFTPHGGRVEVELARKGSRIRIRVSDSGIGITPHFLPYVFDRFRQADSSTTRTHAGLGIGLGIVRHLVELHGGTVRAESRGENLGATFLVDLPVEAVAMSDGDGEERPAAQVCAPSFYANVDLTGLRILVVEDEPDSRLLLTKVLERRGAGVDGVSSAQEALEAIDHNRPDVLVSDIGLPREDGYTLIKRIRERSPEHGGAIPAVALTAFARDEDRARALAAGFQVHVPKPIEPTELLAVVASLAGR